MGGGNRSRRGHGGAQQSKKIKLLMLGDSGVGKSSLMDRFTEDYFNLTKVGMCIFSTAVLGSFTMRQRGSTTVACGFSHARKDIPLYSFISAGC